MSDERTPPGINEWIEHELRQHFDHDRQAVDESWKDVFETNGGARPAPPPEKPAVSRPSAATIEPGPGDEVVPLRGAPARIAENMQASLSVPVATSQRSLPVKLMEENRRIINDYRSLQGKAKISFTHLIAYAILRALKENRSLNDAYTETADGPSRIVRPQINLGIAIDVAGKSGNRSLLVPNIKNAGALDFETFLEAFNDLVARARNGKLKIDDFQGTTVSLTNPGTVGTVGSVPRLMPGQGAIIATGVIDFPAEYRGVALETRRMLGIGKVMNVTCTYDHRIIQGAESGLFLGRLQELLEGNDNFFDQVFTSLKMPYHPIPWEQDRQSATPGGANGRTAEIAKEASVLQLINAYRVRGHLIADLDPLGVEPAYHPELDPVNYGLTLWDLDREFLTGTLGQPLDEGSPHRVATLRQILETVRRTYCGKVGCEYMNIQHPEQKQWLQQRMEPEANLWPLEKAQKYRILERLLEAEEFEHFLGARFVGHKRFSLEGAEAAIVILHELIDAAADSGMEAAVIGMAHRGRLNVLCNVVGKPYRQIFAEFEGHPDPNSAQGSGDVKYHLGATGTRFSPAGNQIGLSVSPNPSHLEAVDPVVQGIVRSRQERLNDQERRRVIPILVHGDAAFAGQGVVAETFNFSQLRGYRTGGTVHIIINNQIGFTTSPEEARSSPYSTDVAKMVQAPIFHVNGDDPESVARVVQIAFDYRQEFGKDVVIDMFCYRKHGHNEADDPSYTQPILYRKIRNHRSVAELYAERMVREEVVTSGQVEGLRKEFKARLSEGYEKAQEDGESYETEDLAIVNGGEVVEAGYCPRTAVTRSTIETIINKTTSFPSDFRPHPKLEGHLKRRRGVLDGKPFDWATAETIAFGSLVLDGTPVRLSGQDSCRGTFSQRHLAFFDYDDGREYLPLQHLSPDQAQFEALDSSLSEYAVVGFEFGYSVADPLTLVLWEAQFGDFGNGAQIMIDQFITCAEMKWGQPSGLVMLLPHGYEGQGPEHSSARIERFLVLTAQNNIQLANCTTPAQYFHLLRRQMVGGIDRRGIRKPLVVFTPKSLLRHPKAVSEIGELTSGGFREILDDPQAAAPDRIGRVLLCSGKVYYDLIEERKKREAHNVAIVRVEQLYPFAHADMREILSRYSDATDVIWVQEEPRNMGPWRFMREKIEPLLEDSGRELYYAGRAESASPATGSHKRHVQELKEFMDHAFSKNPAAHGRARRNRA